MDHKLAGKRILIVEDEYFIASDLKRALDAEGVVVVGPVGDLTLGLKFARRDIIDAAILDVNLEGAMSYPIADQLAAARIPYLFLTGYDIWSLHPDYAATPRVAKPFVTAQLIRAVEELCFGKPTALAG